MNRDEYSHDDNRKSVLVKNRKVSREAGSFVQDQSLLSDTGSVALICCIVSEKGMSALRQLCMSLWGQYGV